MAIENSDKEPFRTVKASMQRQHSHIFLSYGWFILVFTSDDIIKKIILD